MINPGTKTSTPDFKLVKTKVCLTVVPSPGKSKSY